MTKLGFLRCLQARHCGFEQRVQTYGPRPLRMRRGNASFVAKALQGLVECVRSAGLGTEAACVVDLHALDCSSKRVPGVRRCRWQSCSPGRPQGGDAQKL